MGVWIDSALESTAVHSVFILVGLLWAAVDRGQLFVADEWNSGLHPSLTRELFRVAYESLAASTRAQVILTSHDLSSENSTFCAREAMCSLKRDADVVPLAVRSGQPQRLIVDARETARAQSGEYPQSA